MIFLHILKLSKSALAKVLINDDLIYELVKQLDGKSKQEVKFEGSYYQYTYEPLFNKWGYAFRLVWCCDKNNPCDWRSKYNLVGWPWC